MGLSSQTRSIDGATAFFLRNLCTAPTDPGWPCGLFAFHGIFEYGYLDSTIGTVNSSVTDKPSIENIQDFRISQFTDSTGTLRQFRGASGWYFQAAASTGQVRVNNTVNDERDIANRSSWLNIVDYWSNGPTPPVTGLDFKGLNYLFMGATTFGGYLYGTRDPDVLPGQPNYPVIMSSPGPIRMTYLYGDVNASNNCQMQFELQSACKARLKGTTQSIPNWATSGSLVPDTSEANTSIKSGTDNYIVFDGLRAIRIRPLGWLAHMADHIMKQSDRFNSGIFPGGMTMVWKMNGGPFAYDGTTPLGDYTEQGSTVGGVFVYNNKIEFTGFHHRHFGDWCESHLGAPDRFQLRARAKVWFTSAGGGTSTAQADPYKVLLTGSTTTWTPPDEVVEVQATQRNTVHTGPSGPPLFIPPDYAHNAGFVFSFAQTVNKIAYLHVTYHYGDQVIGTQFWGGHDVSGFPCTESYSNTIGFTKINASDVVTDNFTASLVGMPFGATTDSPLPKVYLAIKSVTGTRFRAVSFQIFWTVPIPAGSTYTIDWGDGSTSTGISTLTPSHTYDTDISGTKYRVVLTAYWSGGTNSHGTYISL
jgi:hypothetical protein